MKKNFFTLLPGMLMAILLFSIAIAICCAIIMHQTTASPWLEVWQNRYQIWQALQFTLLQSLLSTLLSLLPAIFIARAFYRRQFWGRTLLLRASTACIMLPGLLVVIGLLTILGHTGWLAHCLDLFNINYTFSLYGLTGILFAHLFFNLPLTTYLLLQALSHLPNKERQLASQLGMRDWDWFRLIELPYLLPIIRGISTLIFMLCFSSFTIILLLGGGPKTTTLDILIYQALLYDYNFPYVAYLTCIKLFCCILFVWLNHRFQQITPVSMPQQQQTYCIETSRLTLLFDSLLLLLFAALLLLPLVAIIINALISETLLFSLQQSALWQATYTSFALALCSGLVAIIMAISLLWSSRALRLQQQNHWAQWIEASGMVLFAIPSIVIATGLFLLYQNFLTSVVYTFLLIMLANALLVLPYMLNLLAKPMHDSAVRYHRLCLSLNITGWHRLYWIDVKGLRPVLINAFAWACLLSLGDLGATALLGGYQIITLPYFLYQQLSAYYHKEAEVTAALLLLISLFCLVITQFGQQRINNDKI